MGCDRNSRPTESVKAEREREREREREKKAREREKETMDFWQSIYQAGWAS